MFLFSAEGKAKEEEVKRGGGQKEEGVVVVVLVASNYIYHASVQEQVTSTNILS